MKPGREFDKVVAEAMGYADLRRGRLAGELYGHHPTRSKSKDELRYVPHYSTDTAASMEAFGWLEENHPWLYLDRWGGQKADLLLGRKDGKPAVYVMRSYWDSSNMDGGVNLAITGETYPHAICLAILEIKEWIKL